MADFMAALDEVQPAFGSNTESLELSRRHGILDYGDAFKHLQSTLRTLVAQVCGARQGPSLPGRRPVAPAVTPGPSGLCGWRPATPPTAR
jgi:vesicle-fusing ATPase